MGVDVSQHGFSRNNNSQHAFNYLGLSILNSKH